MSMWYKLKSIVGYKKGDRIEISGPFAMDPRPRPRVEQHYLSPEKARLVKCICGRPWQDHAGDPPHRIVDIGCVGFQTRTDFPLNGRPLGS